MKNIKLLLLLLCGVGLLSVSCNNDDDGDIPEPSYTIVQTAVMTDDLSTLVAALGYADANAGTELVRTLNGSGPFTVLAPSNAAFNDLLGSLDGFDSLEDFDTEEELDLLAWILQYHVVAGAAVMAQDLSDGQSVTTVQGESLTVDLSGGAGFTDATGETANVTTADVEASNGVVHIIDKVLIPQAVLDALSGSSEDDLVSLVVNADNLTVLEEAVLKAQLETTLSGDGPFTVFAPTDDAFVALLDMLGDDYTSLDDFDTEAEMNLLTNILLYHVVPGNVTSSDLAAGNVETAFSGNALEVIESGDGFVIGDASDVDANIDTADIMASNGVVHLIDKVLLPQEAIDFAMDLMAKNIVELAVETDDLSVLVDALMQADAGLVELLSGDGPFTVFAPTNDAFVALLDALGDDYMSLADFDTDAEKQLLADILTYHVLTANVTSGDLSAGSVETAYAGNSIEVISSGGGFVIGDATDVDANIAMADIMASNGVVHVVDKVLLPQAAVDFAAGLMAKNIVELAVETDDLSVLVDALMQADAGLVELLSGDGPFTVFAPTNDAFVALLDALGDDYMSLADFDTDAEKQLLADILTYHVLTANVTSGDLSAGSVETAYAGNSIEVISSGGGFVIGDATDVDANIAMADIMASNGVVHVVDKVLLPQAAVDFAAGLMAKNIVELAVETDDLSVLVDALMQADAGLVELLSGDGPFTVFAPTNDAFVALLDALGDDYMSLADFDTDAEKQLLADILTYHVLTANVTSGDLSAGSVETAYAGNSIEVISSGGGFVIGDATDVDANIAMADIMASNGVVHVVDKVLLPQAAVDFAASL